MCFSARNHLFVGSRTADFVAPWTQILAKAMVKGILGRLNGLRRSRRRAAKSVPSLLGPD
jgi:hypothetical protein